MLDPARRQTLYEAMQILVEFLELDAEPTPDMAPDPPTQEIETPRALSKS